MSDYIYKKKQNTCDVTIGSSTSTGIARKSVVVALKGK